VRSPPWGKVIISRGGHGLQVGALSEEEVRAEAGQWGLSLIEVQKRLKTRPRYGHEASRVTIRPDGRGRETTSARLRLAESQ